MVQENDLNIINFESPWTLISFLSYHASYFAVKNIFFGGGIKWQFFKALSFTLHTGWGRNRYYLPYKSFFFFLSFFSSN